MAFLFLFQINDVQYAHEFVAAVYRYHQTNDIPLPPGIRRTLNDLLIGIYDDLDGVKDVSIDMYLENNEYQTPLHFRCTFKSGKSTMAITISYDGKKEIKFPNLHWWPRFTRFVRKHFLKRIICGVIGGAVGFGIAGIPGAVAGASIGLLADDKVIDLVIGYVGRLSIHDK